MQCELELQGNRGVLTFWGDLTISHAASMKEVLLSSLRGFDDLEVHFRGVREADLSAVQLMCAAHRQAVRDEKRLVFTRGEGSSVLWNLAEKAGFALADGCERGCLWIGDCNE